MNANRIELIYIFLGKGAQFNSDGSTTLGVAFPPEIVPPYLPGTLANVSVVFKLRFFAPPKHSSVVVSFELCHEDGEAIAEVKKHDLTVAINEDESHSDYEGIFQFEGITFRRPGEHFFALTIDGKRIGKTSVKILKPERTSVPTLAANEFATP